MYPGTATWYLFQSPSGSGHLSAEGYSVCHYEAAGAGEPTEYTDQGFRESGWQEPYKVQQPGGRNTFPSRDTAELDLTVTMTVYNRSNKPLTDVGISRHADLDVNGGPAGDVFLATPHSVIARDQLGQAVSMTDLGGAGVIDAQGWDYSNWIGSGAGTCAQSAAIFPPTYPTVPGDYAGAIRRFFWGKLAPNASRTMKIVYRAQ